MDSEVVYCVLQVYDRCNQESTNRDFRTNSWGLIVYDTRSSNRATTKVVTYRLKEDFTSMASSKFMVIFAIGFLFARLVIFNFGVRSVSSPEKNWNQNSLNTFKKPTRRRLEKRRGFDSTADGTFSGYPIYLREHTEAQTLPHCVGEDYQTGKSWKHKSCKFEFFCFDTTSKEFVVYQPPSEQQINHLLAPKPFVDVSQSYLQPGPNRTNSMSLGGINMKWGDKENGIQRLEWFPEIRTRPAVGPLVYYELPPEVVIVPFHSMNGGNPGHLVWDDFLPTYTLLTMFQLERDTELLMMRYVLKDGRGLWASCDWKDDKRELCGMMHRKFAPLMVGTDSLHNMTTTEDFHFEVKGDVKSSLVCARHGLAGMGSLTDHGEKLHGWEDSDYGTTQNHGRGGLLYDFRNFMMSNIGVSQEYTHVPPFRIVFSEKSSENLSRNLDFERQKEILRQSFNPQYVSVESYVFKDIPLVQQVDLAGQTTIYISGVGGGAVTAMFLPRGASLLLYFMATAGLEGGRASGKPARLDWDLFNNLGYLKVHWLPTETMNEDADLRSLVLLVQHELDALIRERSYDKIFY